MTDSIHNEHGHSHHGEAPKKSKYEEALDKYNLDIDDNAVREEVKSSSPRRFTRTTRPR